MNKEELIKYFLEHPSLVRESKAKYVAKQYKLDLEFTRKCLKLAKEQLGEAGIKKGSQHLLNILNNYGLKLEDIKTLKAYGNAENPMYSITPKEEWFNNGENIKEVIDQIIKKAKEDIKPITLVKKSATSKALFIYTADKHIGAKTENDSLYENEYNAKIFTERLLKCIDIVKDCYDKFGRFDKIYIIDLGDALDGYNQYSTRRSVLLPQNLSNEEQIDTYFSSHKQLFDNIIGLNVTNNIEWISCANDNHGGSWAYAAHKILDVYLETKYPEIKRTIITKFLDHIQYGSHTFIFTHGKDKKDMKFGLPLILNDKAELFINQYIHYNKIHTPNIHVIKGDLHQSATQVGKLFRYKNCRSLYGASSWIMNNFGMNLGGIDYEIVEKNEDSIFENRIVFK